LESDIASFGIFQIKGEMLVNECARHSGAFVGFASAVEALQTESANPQGMLLHTENTAQWMRKNTRLEVEVVLLGQWAQPALAAHTLRVAG
jgi:hypothetical protein